VLVLVEGVAVPLLDPKSPRTRGSHEDVEGVEEAVEGVGGEVEEMGGEVEERERASGG